MENPVNKVLRGVMNNHRFAPVDAWGVTKKEAIAQHGFKPPIEAICHRELRREAMSKSGTDDYGARCLLACPGNGTDLECLL